MWDAIWMWISAPISFGVGFYVFGGHKLPQFRRLRLPQLRARRHVYDMTKNKKFVRHDRERREQRIEAEERWLAEWVHLLGGQAYLSSFHDRQLRYPDLYGHVDEKTVRREAERARIAEIIQAHEQAKKKMAQVIAERAQREIEWKKNAIKIKMDMKRQKWETDYQA